MSDISSNNRIDLSEEHFVESLPKLEPPFSKSKEEVWSAVQQSIGEKADKEQPKARRVSLWQLSAAAVIALLFTTTAFMRFYSESYVTDERELLAVTLPDGSSIQMNGLSSIDFHPYWWKVKREVTLDGEAFFEVQKGEHFDVVSAKGITSVLGTSFNIYARNDDYEVTCHTGKVRVTNAISHHYVDITPQQMVRFESDGTITKEEKVDLGNSIFWTEEMFVFEATPIAEVFHMIERQYHVTIDYPSTLDLRYSGKFSRDLSADQVIKMLCRSFNLKYQKRNNHFVIQR
jgi:transmembrane sensor